MKIRFLNYADIHHSEDNLDDTLRVEDQIDNYFLENKMDFIIFGGDRFKSRNPSGPLRDIADGVLKRRNDKGIPCYMLVGNHDQYDKTGKENSYGVAKMFEEEMEFVTVMDESNYYIYARRDVARIFAIPFGGDKDKFLKIFEMMNKKAKGFDILVFHDLIEGTILHLDAGVRAKGGLTLKDIDRPEFDIVLGADNHIPQMFDLKNTVGGYVGSTLQHTKADAGDKRGFLDVTLEEGKESVVKFVESCASKMVFIDINAPDNWEEASFEVISSLIPKTLDNAKEVGEEDIQELKGNKVTLTLEGSSNVIDKLSRDKSKMESFLKEAWKAKSVRIIFKRYVEFSEGVEGMKEAKSPEDDLQLYLGSKYAEKFIGGLDKERLYEVGVKLLREE